MESISAPQTKLVGYTESRKNNVKNLLWADVWEHRDHRRSESISAAIKSITTTYHRAEDNGQLEHIWSGIAMGQERSAAARRVGIQDEEPEKMLLRP
jgi:hypothetical protein